MKTIFLILKKDLKLFFGNKKAVILTFIIPIILISLFSFAFGGIGKQSKTVKQIELLYTNYDQSEFSNKIIGELTAVKELKMIATTEIEGDDLLKKGNNSCYLIIHDGFQDSLKLGNELPIVLKYDASQPFELGILKSIVTAKIMNSVGAEIQKIKTKKYLDNSFSNLSEIQKETITKDILESESSYQPNSISLKTVSILKEQEEKGNLGLIQAVSGTAIMMLLFSISGIGGGLLEEKEAGTLTRLLYAPLKLTSILYGKMGAAFIVSLLQLSVMFAFTWLAFGLPILNDVFSLVVLSVAVAFAVSSFGIFLVSIAKTRQQLQGLSTIVILVMSAIGGSMIPLFIMPNIMQKIAVISLNYWGIQGYFDIFWRKLPFIEILPKIAVLCAIGFFMIAISIPLFKKNVASFTN